jgi:hypothetical protein
VRKVLFVLLGLLVLAAGAAAAAAWRYDAARDDRLAEGISIAGVEVGGMRRAEARGVLAERIGDPLAQPISVLYRGGQFVFSPSTAELATNLDRLLVGALSESRDGNFLTRAFRDFTGGRLSTRLDLDVTYSNEAVQRFARSVSKTVDTKPREGKSKASFVGIRIRPSRNGVAVRKPALSVAIEDALVDPESARSLELPTRILRPKVTTRELQKRFRFLIAVSRSRKELSYFVK